jgi:hypothetical protein
MVHTENGWTRSSNNSTKVGSACSWPRSIQVTNAVAMLVVATTKQDDGSTSTSHCEAQTTKSNQQEQQTISTNSWVLSAQYHRPNALLGTTMSDESDARKWGHTIAQESSCWDEIRYRGYTTMKWNYELVVAIPVGFEATASFRQLAHPSSCHEPMKEPENPYQPATNNQQPTKNSRAEERERERGIQED